MTTRPVSAFLLVSNILAQNRGIVCLCLERIYNHRQFFILDLDSSDTISGSIAVIGNDKCNFLCLKQHLSIGEYHLLVTSQSRHPMQAQRCQISCSQNGVNSGNCHCLFRVDCLDAGMCIRRTYKIAE